MSPKNRERWLKFWQDPERAAKLAAGGAYGKVSAEEYLEMLRAVEEPKELKATFAEYYEIDMSDKGEFIVSYSGICRECKFAHKFKHEEQVKLK